MEGLVSEIEEQVIDIPKRIYRLMHQHSLFCHNLRPELTLIYARMMLKENCSNCSIAIFLNQRIHKLALINCHNVNLQLLDSIVIMTQVVEVQDCSNCTLFFDATDVRKLFIRNVRYTIYNSSLFLEFESFWSPHITVQYDTDSLPVAMETRIIADHVSSMSSSFQVVDMKPGVNPNEVPLIPLTVASTTQFDHCGEGEAIEFTYSLDHKVTFKSIDFNSQEAAKQLFNEIEIIDNAAKSRKITDSEWAQYYDAEVRLYEESAEILQEKARKTAEYLRKSNHCVVYTGAGVSTSARIPAILKSDYRGPEGAWTLRSKGIGVPPDSVSFSQALPTYTHYALTELLRRGFIKYIVTTNMDGLHRRSGTDSNQLSELHGSCYREYCVICGRDFLRGFDVLYTREDRWTHRTGRTCPCGGALRDTLVHFTEQMPPVETSRALEHAFQSDLSLVLGTSMNVQPAASYPHKCRRKGGKVILVNLQKTPYDRETDLKVYAKIDEFMELLMGELGIESFDREYDHLQTVILHETAEEEARKKRNQFNINLLFVLSAALLAGFLVFRRK